MSVPAPAASTNLRAQTVEGILGKVANLGKNVATYSSGAGSAIASSATSLFEGETGNYILKTLFYFILYSFVLFLVLVLVHFTLYPIFRFGPADKGFLGVPMVSRDDIVVWNERKQPPAQSLVPADDSPLGLSDFVNTFSFSVDLYIRRLQDTVHQQRLILFKTNSRSDPIPAPDPSDDLVNHMSKYSSMIVYCTDKNDLVVTFFSGSTPTFYSCPPIRNVPLFTPFRLSVVVERRLFTVYLNGKQTFQRILPTPLVLNTSGTNLSQPQKFYSAPLWADAGGKTVFVQNFHLWPRIIGSQEVLRAQPALARAEDFDLPAEPLAQGCS